MAKKGQKQIQLEGEYLDAIEMEDVGAATESDGKSIFIVGRRVGL
jgi:hypothetical protein